MTVHQLPWEIREFARYLRELTALLDPEAGWYGVFGHRDPDGLRACRDGAEIPPWDVVESLIQDLTAGRDPHTVATETERARRLHAASVAAHDRRPGGREALAERLRLMLREQAFAAGRADELVRLVRTAPAGTPDAERHEHDLAWIRDDHARASARCAELRSRIDALTTPGRGAATPRPAAPDGWFRIEDPAPDEDAAFGESGPPAARSGPGRRAAGADARDPAERPGASGTRGVPHWAGTAEESGRELTEPAVSEDSARSRAQAPAKPKETPKGPKESKGKKRVPAPRRAPRGARFAGLEIDEADGTGESGTPGEEAAVPEPAPGAPPYAPAAPRGARFGGVPAAPTGEAAPAYAPEDRQAAARTVAALIRLRAEGRTGEAHVVLCEAAGRPPAQLPLLAAELHRAGLGADWAELLWEAAWLPPAQLAAAAGALAAAGRDGDCGHLLRQGAARPADEITDAVLALGEAGRAPEAKALLSAFVQTRTPADAVRVAAPDPVRLVPQLLDAARAVSMSRVHDLVHALRAAGIANV
ncbi:hypothetical protein [Streptomyces sp. NPDC051569]|uniref:hypothetical protein n=1 Tax=Streptomyces sp. NPDC051569 TaxID=3365661 RepID=UPI0037BD17A2